MAYHDHFKLADDMISHLDSVIGGITDSFVTSRYVGFVAVAAVTVYELAAFYTSTMCSTWPPFRRFSPMRVKLPPQRQFVALSWLSLAGCASAEPASVLPAAKANLSVKKAMMLPSKVVCLSPAKPTGPVWMASLLRSPADRITGRCQRFRKKFVYDLFCGG